VLGQPMNVCPFGICHQGETIRGLIGK
jgi:hypothetical protein